MQSITHVQHESHFPAFDIHYVKGKQLKIMIMIFLKEDDHNADDGDSYDDDHDDVVDDDDDGDDDMHILIMIGMIMIIFDW